MCKAHQEHMLQGLETRSRANGENNLRIHETETIIPILLFCESPFLF